MKKYLPLLAIPFSLSFMTTAYSAEEAAHADGAKEKKADCDCRGKKCKTCGHKKKDCECKHDKKGKHHKGHDDMKTDVEPKAEEAHH